jgi:hypothetical protein
VVGYVERKIAGVLRRIAALGETVNAIIPQQTAQIHIPRSPLIVYLLEWGSVKRS